MSLFYYFGNGKFSTHFERQNLPSKKIRTNIIFGHFWSFFEITSSTLVFFQKYLQDFRLPRKPPPLRKAPKDKVRGKRSHSAGSNAAGEQAPPPRGNGVAPVRRPPHVQAQEAGQAAPRPAGVAAQAAHGAQEGRGSGV